MITAPCSVLDPFIHIQPGMVTKPWLYQTRSGRNDNNTLPVSDPHTPSALTPLQPGMEVQAAHSDLPWREIQSPDITAGHTGPQ